MTIFAGLFIFVFGALGVWLLARRFPGARFLRSGYGCMSGGGLLFVVWTLSKALPVGVIAGGLLALGATLGIVGTLRKELRLMPPDA